MEPFSANVQPGPSSSLLSHCWYEANRCWGYFCLTLGFSMRDEGLHNMPDKGPVLVIANHESYFDPWMIGVVIRRPMTFLARKSLFRNPLFGRIIRSVNAVPIDQDGIGKEGIRIVINELRKEHAVLVFPEGERCEDGLMHPFRPGIHLLIRKAEAQIVPVGVAGAFEAYPRFRPVPTFAPLFLPPNKGTLAVSVGEPIDSRRYADMPRDQAMKELFDVLHGVQQRAEKLRRK